MTSDRYDESASTTPARNRQRVSYDRSAVHAVLDAATVCHVGFVVDGRPVVLPQLYARVDEQLYLHASSGARLMRMVEKQPVPICVTVTVVDGIVLARSAFNHSINYRAVVAHGPASLVVDEDEKSHVLTTLVDAVVAGRSGGTRGPNRRELAATAVLRLPLVEVSLKQRSGPPKDDDDDLGLPYWAGVLPVATTAGAAIPAPDLVPTISVPDHVRRWTPYPRTV